MPVDVNDYKVASQAKKSECAVFQKAVNLQESEKFSDALIGYNDFITRYASSALLPAVQRQTEALLLNADKTELAQAKVCEKVEVFKKNQLILESDRWLPLYRACGNFYAAKQEHKNAIAMYEQILKEAPNGTLASQIKPALAQSMVAEAEEQRATEILPPPLAGETASGYTVVEIQNDSPTELRFVFTGPETRFEEIQPCKECQVYKDEETAECPKKGSVQRYNLKPGDYKIVVKSIGEIKTIPFRGNWSLEDGKEYRNCFIIVDFPIDEKNNDLGKEAPPEEQVEETTTVPNS